jgi:hypothetical protein
MPIRNCNCKSEYQDKKYGIGRRVFNKGIKVALRCTVCAREVKSDVEPK